MHRKKRFAIIPCLISVKDVNVKKSLFNSIYPGCIIIVKKFKKTMIYLLETDASNKGIMSTDQHYKSSCARCRVFDSSTWRLSKQLEELMKRFNVRNIKTLISDAFDGEEIQEPKLIELMGSERNVYSFEKFEIISEISLKSFSKELQFIIKYARSKYSRGLLNKKSTTMEANKRQ